MWRAYQTATVPASAVTTSWSGSAADSSWNTSWGFSGSAGVAARASRVVFQRVTSPAMWSVHDRCRGGHATVLRSGRRGAPLVTGSLDFLAPTGAPTSAPTAVGRSPVERQAAAAGARCELRDGWNVAVGYPGEAGAAVVFADSSHLPKVEVHGAHGMELGVAERRDGAWWCPVTRERALVIGAAPPGIDVTTTYAALTIAGPSSRELLARFCALDLRPQAAPPRAFRPGSVARTPGYVLRENGDHFL